MDEVFDLIEYTELAIFILAAIIIFFLIFKRIQDKGKEKFEERDN